MATENRLKKSKLNLRITLILYALIPLVCSSIVFSIVVINKSSNVMKDWTSKSLLQVVMQTGTAFDTQTGVNESILEAYAAAPIVADYLKNPSDQALFCKP